MTFQERCIKCGHPNDRICNTVEGPICEKCIPTKTKDLTGFERVLAGMPVSFTISFLRQRVNADKMDKPPNIADYLKEKGYVQSKSSQWSKKASDHHVNKFTYGDRRKKT